MGARLVIVAAGLLLSATGVVVARQEAAAGPQGRTTKDGVYTKAQAESGRAMFEKMCTTCHDFKPSEKSGTYPDLGGQAFLDKWNGRSVLDVMTVIYTSMPNDGSAFLDEAQAADLAAYILQQNGFPPGTAPLKADASARQVTIVK